MKSMACDFFSKPLKTKGKKIHFFSLRGEINRLHLPGFVVE
jgi:hypothetical protein